MGLVINKLLQEEVDLTADAVMMSSLEEIVADTIPVWTDTASNTAITSSVIEDGVETGDGLVVQASLHTVLSESFDLLLSLLTDDALYITLALDTERLAPSVHNMIGFNSFALIGDVLFAAGDAGIYKLTGDTDDGVAFTSGVLWGKTSFGRVSKKKIRAVFLEGNIDGTVMQAATATGSEDYTTVRNRVSVSRNLKGRDWDLRLAKFDRLEAMEFLFIMGRR